MTDVAEEVDYPSYLDKEPTILQARFAAWLLTDAVGYNPATAKSKQAAFEEGVRLAVALRMHFQASPYNRAENEKVKAANAAKREKAVTEAPAPAPAPAPAAAKTAKKAAKKAAAPAAAPVEAPAAEEAPAKRAPARRAPARRAAAAAPAAATSAPF